MFPGEQQTCMGGARAHAIWADLNQSSHDPIMGEGGVKLGPAIRHPWGALPKMKKLIPTGNCCAHSAWFRKDCSCILEGHLFTNFILSAFHLEGPKFEIYIYIYMLDSLLWINNWLGFQSQSELSMKWILKSKKPKSYEWMSISIWLHSRLGTTFGTKDSRTMSHWISAFITIYYYLINSF